MPLDTTVKIFHSGMSGAPVLSGTAGAMIGVLDACLVNGWGTATVDSVVIASGSATVTRGAGHPFEADMVCEIAGASVTGGSLNGQRKVMSVVSATQYTIDAEGIPNQTATGTITHKVAPAGWAKAFSGTNLAAYRSSDVTGSRFYCRVDDTGARNARVRGYEAMTDINTGTGLFPTDAQVNGGVFWVKSNAADATPRRWVVFADAKFFYIAVSQANSLTAINFSLSAAFGDLAGRSGTDVYATVCFGADSSLEASTPGSQSNNYLPVLSSPVGHMALARAPSGLGGSVNGARQYFQFMSPLGSAYESGAATNGNIAFPNTSDGGLYLSPLVATSGTTTAGVGQLRGRFPGAFCVPQFVGNSTFPHLNTIAGVTGYAGRRFSAINSASGVTFFDVTGPWV